MAVSIRYVDTANIQQVWPTVKPFIADAMDKGDDFPELASNYNLDHILAFLTMGQWLLLVAIDEENKVHGAATISFINYPLHRVAFVTALGGKFVTGEESVKQFKQVMRLRGATKVQGLVRPAMERYLGQLGFEPRNRLVEVVL